jgi:iron complex transport system ATP-binding protein
MLEAKNLGLQVKNKWLVKDVNFCFEEGKHYAICGPNGAGKSTLLKLLGLELPSSVGGVYYDHSKSNYKHLPSLSRYRAVLSQHLDIGFPLTVEEIVLMGRYPHAQTCSVPHNEKVCREVMDWVDVARFADRDYNTLSGGEKQRVQFARVLAQVWETPAGSSRYLMLDEPITYLDLKHQLEFLQKVNELLDEQTVVISVLHDLNLVMQYATDVLLMIGGSIYESGSPLEVLNQANIRQVFEVDSRMVEVEGNSFLWVK